MAEFRDIFLHYKTNFLCVHITSKKSIRISCLFVYLNNLQFDNIDGIIIEKKNML